MSDFLFPVYPQWKMNPICSHSCSTWDSFDKRFPVCNTHPPGMLSGVHVVVVAVVSCSSPNSIYFFLFCCTWRNGVDARCPLGRPQCVTFLAGWGGEIFPAKTVLAGHSGPSGATCAQTSNLRILQLKQWLLCNIRNRSIQMFPSKARCSWACFTRAALNTWRLQLIPHYCYLFNFPVYCWQSHSAVCKSLNSRSAWVKRETRNKFHSDKGPSF